ncbi:hypothetical protein KGV52_00795 [Candidatus Gracilibacteria bacterium]|nr:hypothetical protein [Candidatus Gracilibacteria bacterium]
MKRTKREQNAIIINFVLFLTLTGLLGYFCFSYIYPNMIEIENTKASVLQVSQDLEKKKKEGIDYKDYTDTYENVLASLGANNHTNKSYIKSITQSIDKVFYDTHFKNKDEAGFDEFIRKLEKKYQKGKDDNKDQIKKLNYILPSYVENISDINFGKDDNSIHYLTDFRFINYIETIIDQFNLTYNNPIGISDTVLVSDYSVSETGTTLDKNIYYIPVELDLKGDKRYVLLFLYYLENVGNILVNEDKEEITIVTPEILQDRKKMLEALGKTEKAQKKITEKTQKSNNKNTKSQEKKGEEKTKNKNIDKKITEKVNTPEIPTEVKEEKQSPIYKSSLFQQISYRKINDYPEKYKNNEKETEKKYNVFNNQVIDIETISFEEYIDSDPSFGSLTEGSENNLLRNIFPQLKEEFRFKVKLRFYVKGLPKYKIEELIQGTTSLYNDLKTKAEKEKSNTKLDGNQQERIGNLLETLKSLDTQIQEIGAKGKAKISFTEKYNKSYEVKKVLLDLEKQFNEIIK